MAYLNESHIEVADINFFTEKLGYKHINAWEKKLMGRETLKDVVLLDQLRSSLEKHSKSELLIKKFNLIKKGDHYVLKETKTKDKIEIAIDFCQEALLK